MAFVQHSPSKIHLDSDQTAKRSRTRQAMINCSICKKSCDVNDEVLCKSCGQISHYQCININQNFHDYFIKDKGWSWNCPGCSIKNTNDTEIRLHKNITDMKNLQQQYKTLEERIDTQTQRTHAFEGQLSVICETIKIGAQTHTKHFNNLQEQINEHKDHLQRELCYLQGKNNAFNLIVSAVPYNHNEDLRKYMLEITKNLKVNIQQGDITKAHRMGNLQASSTEDKPLPILYCFKHIGTRNHIFKNYIENLKKKNYITLSTIGISSDDRIYINQHVPHCLNELYKIAMAWKKDGKLEMVNPKANAIAVKKKDGAWINVQTKTQLQQIEDW